MAFTKVAFGASTRARANWRRSKSLLVVIAIMGGYLAFGNPADAVHDLSMELDGNTAVVDTSAPLYDWESLFQADADTGDIVDKGALPTGFLARGSIADYKFPETTRFTTGSKDTLNIGPITSPKRKAAGWQCGESSNLLAKNDLVNVYTAAYRNPANNHLILYFGAEKSSNLGDNNIGIWFLQDSAVGCVVPVNGRNTDFTGHHEPGDVLLTAAFTNGGNTALVEARTWVASAADNGGEGKLSEATGGFLCGSPESATAGDKACAITNTAVNNPPKGEINPPWNHPLKTPGDDGVSLAPQEFYEGGVDVTQLQIDAGNTGDPCITTFLADTRSSQSPTATLFDFAKGALPVCQPATTLAASVDPSTIHSGDSVTWTLQETNTGTSTLDQVTVSSPDCSPFVYVSGDNPNGNPNGLLEPVTTNAAAETWTFTCTQTVTASTTLDAFGSGRDTVSGKIVTGDPALCDFNDNVNPPTGTPKTGVTNTICDPNERASASVTVINPSTDLTATAATASPPTINAGGDSVTITAYEKNDGDVILTNPSITTTDLSDCSTFTLVTGTAGGDTDNDAVFDPGETWKFTCTTTAISATTTVNLIGSATDPLGANVTYYTTNGADCTAGTISNGNLCDLQERTTVTVTVINPSTILTTTASAVITYRFSEHNNGDSPLTAVSVTAPAGQCDAAPAYLSGDLSPTGQLDPGETWVFTCTKTLTGPTTDPTTGLVDTGETSTTATGTGHGTDATGDDVTHCDPAPATNSNRKCSTTERDGTTVTITNNARD